jgi:hypothetical protein
MRSVSEILGDIRTNQASFDSTREYFGAMWNCDVQASMFRQSSYKQLEQLRAELKGAIMLVRDQPLTLPIALGVIDAYQREEPKQEP